MKKLLYLLTILLLFCLGCKKDVIKAPPVANLSVNGHLQLMQGGNQIDTVGNQLKDSVIVKVLFNNAPASGYTVEFVRSGCEDPAVTKKTSSSSGQVSYAWYLSGETGGQSLNIILLDGQGVKQDSLSVAATGVAGVHGWHRGGCLQNFPVNTVNALSSGRILASVNATGYPYYSDDNAVSWHPLKTFSKSYFISKMLTTAGGTYIATQSDGLFFSSDNGQSWANISGNIWSDFSDLAYTRSGHLIVANIQGLYLSDDNGQTWNEEDFGLPAGKSRCPVEDLMGDLFVIGADAAMYKLPVHTSKWIYVGSYSNYLLSSVESQFIDAQGNMFIGSPMNSTAGTGYLYESVDAGQSWSPVFSAPGNGTAYPNINNISQINRTYYFSFAGSGIYQTSDFKFYTNATTQFANAGDLVYTVSKQSTFIVGSPGYGIYYKAP